MADNPVYARDGKLVIGQLTSDGVFVQKVKAGQTLRMLNAKGLDISTWTHLVAEGCKIWRLHFGDNTMVEIPFSQVGVLGIIKEVDAKAGRQIFVNLEYFHGVVSPKRYIE